MTAKAQDLIRPVAIDELDLRYAQLRLANPVRVARLRDQLAAEGLRQPLLVSDGVEERQLVLIDGFKRFAAARELGLGEVLVRVLALDAVGAEVAMIRANEPRRGLAEVEEGFIVRSLHRTHGRAQVEIAELVGRHKSWVCRRLSLVEQLAPEVIEDLRLGLISATVGRELARLPRDPLHCCAQRVPRQRHAAQAVAAHGLSSRQATGLVKVLGAMTDPTQRRAVLDNPLAHLPVTAGRRQEGHDPRLRWLANQVRRQMLWLEATAGRILEVFRVHGTGTLCPREREILGELAATVLPRARAALAALEVHTDCPGRGEDDRSPGDPAAARL